MDLGDIGGSIFQIQIAFGQKPILQGVKYMLFAAHFCHIIWRLPESQGYPQSSSNHPAIGVPPFMETPFKLNLRFPIHVSF